MYKLLIVDDDFSTRVKLKAMMDWNKEGFEVCGEASNGLIAIQMLEVCQPDIIITDISMPVMDGIELIEHIEKKHPGIKVIALSGYDDFEYVRKSMKKGAVDYLLKHHLSEKAILSVLKAAVDDIKKEKDENSQIRNMQEQLSVSKDILRNSFLIRLVSGEITDPDEIERNIHSLNIELDTRNLALIISEIDDFLFIKEKYSSQEIKILVQSFLDISRKTLSGNGKTVIFQIDGNKFAIIVSLGKARSDLYIYNQLVSMVDTAKSNIKRFLNITASWSISSIFYNIADIHKYYVEAEKRLQDKFFKGKDKIIREAVEKTESKKDFYRLNIDDEKKLEKMLKCLDLQKVNELIGRIFDEVESCKLNYKSVQMICAELINIVNKVARETGIEAGTLYSSDKIPYSEIQKYETVTDLKKWILDVYGRLINLLKTIDIKPGNSVLTKKAIEYISSNYHRNISLNDAAEHLGVNRTYLSHTFKEECKKGFTEYLNTLRVEKAKQLIGNTRLKDIVPAVGFNNYNYFFRVFKDITGMTPVEYEETLK